MLIIEDNIDNGDTLAQVLELGGHRARIARTGLREQFLHHHQRTFVMLDHELQEQLVE